MNQASDNGTTPLYIASEKGHAEVVSILLAKQGVNVNQTMNDGATPLYAASLQGHTEVVSMLLAKQGVGANQAMKGGCTPLWIASRYGHTEVVSLLLAKQGVDVNQATKNGDTPLRIASQNGHAKVVSMLLAKKGIDINKVWNRNRNRSRTDRVTPLRAAIERGHAEIAEQLVMCGSLVDAPTGAHGRQLTLVLGAFAQAFKADFDALCVFRLCLVRAYHDKPPAVEGTPSPAQRRRMAAHRMGRKGSFAVPLIESFLVPCHPVTCKPDLTVRHTLTIILNITAATHRGSTTETAADT